MDYQAFVEQLAQEKNYSENLKKAILLAIPLLIKQYPEEKEDVLPFFQSIQIYAKEEINEEEKQKITEEMTHSCNPHVKEEESNPYQNDEIGSSYSYQAVFDEEMNVVDEIRWIVVKEITGPEKEKAIELFGTSICMYYFLHELDHAFSTRHAIYQKKGNQIYAKHGFLETIMEYQKKDDWNILKTVSVKSLLLEEIFAEKSAQEMMIELLQVKDFQEVKEVMKKILIYPNAYNVILITIGKEFEKALGKDKIRAFRQDNSYDVINEFNEISKQSEMREKYYPNEEPYDYLGKLVFSLYQLSIHRYKLSFQEYESQCLKLLFDSLAPIYGYNEYFGKVSFQDYKTLRENALHEDALNL